MPLDSDNLARLIQLPSLSGITYQAAELISELERINDQEFPVSTRIVREVLLSIAEHIHDELLELYDPQNPLQPKGRGVASRVLSLGNLVHELYSFVRYLSASSPRQSPPAVQLALAQLTSLHFSKSGPPPVAVVRPQWKYNLKCVPLTPLLKEILPRWVLDPGKKLAKGKDELLPSLWTKRLNRLHERGMKPLLQHPPGQIGILSFAALDTPDALYLPLLAHEVGHFIDFSPSKPHHRNSQLVAATEITKEQVKDVIHSETGKTPDPGEVGRIWNILCQQTQICLRELLADLLATRMLGFSFFVAQTKFLKSLASWAQPKVLDSGYPGIKFRLSTILGHLTAEDYGANPLHFFQQTSTERSVGPLLDYLRNWNDFLKNIPLGPRTNSKVFSDNLAQPLIGLVEKVIDERTLKILSGLAADLIPPEQCASLSHNLFERISLLQNDLPPSLSTEQLDSFSEIMSAAWAYQIINGEEREIEKAKTNERLDEYRKTNRLILKAIELIPVCQVSKTPTENNDTEIQVPNQEGSVNDATLIDKIKGMFHRKIDPSQGRKEGQNPVQNRSGVIGFNEILRRTSLPIDDPSRIAILPLRTDAINGASLDVHLGNWFAYARRTKLGSIRIDHREQVALLRTIGRGETFVPSEQSFLIHPGDLVLGITQEFIALPNDVMAFVEGKSGLGRLGLFVATATQVAPGFHGVLVLELANAGTVPLELVPETKIAQLVFQTMTEPVPPEKMYFGKYHCQTKPLSF